MIQGKLFNAKDFIINDFYNYNFLNFNYSYFSKPLVLIGNSVLSRFDSNSIMTSLYYFTKKIFNLSYSSWKPLSIISLYLGRISSFEIGFLPGVASNLNNYKNKALYYFCGVDTYSNLNVDSFIVYQGSLKINTNLFNKANLIFPVSTYVERNSSYMNLEGRIRFTKKIITPFKFVFSDFEIMRALFFVRSRYFLNNFSKLTDFYKVTGYFSNIIVYNSILLFNLNSVSSRFYNLTGIYLNKNNYFDINNVTPIYLNLLLSLNNSGIFFNSIINRSINNYYSSDFFIKNSKIMSMCALKTFSGNFSNNIFKNIN